MEDRNNTNKLIGLLDEATILSSKYRGGYSNRFLSVEEFHNALVQTVLRLKANDYSTIDELWFYFAPTCSWDDFIGLDGMDIGNRIFDLLQKLRDIYTMN